MTERPKTLLEGRTRLDLLRSRIILRLLLFITIFAIPANTCLGNARNSFYLWLEAEQFTTATKNISVIESEKAEMSWREHVDAERLLKISGWDISASQQVSGKGYIQRDETQIDDVQMAYAFSLPHSGEYYIWVRINCPPPCGRRFNVSIDHRDEAFPLMTDVWGVWFWWGWGESHNRGNLKGYSLKKGPHVLFLDTMSMGLRVDKILITDDRHYTPFGRGDYHYTHDFEAPLLASAHGWAQNMSPTDTGWDPTPRNLWCINSKMPLDHYYYVKKPGEPKTAGRLAYALVRNCEFDLFEVKIDLLWGSESGHEKNALIISGFKNEKEFDAVEISGRGIAALSMRSGELSTILRISCDITSISSVLPVFISRTRTNLEVRANGRKVIDTPMAFPQRGGVGIGSTTGDIGFDNVYFSNPEDPRADFDFSLRQSPTLRNWVVFRRDRNCGGMTKTPLQKGDLLLYNTPGWCGGELTMKLKEENRGRFSILFPYNNTRSHFSLIIDTSKCGSVKMTKKTGGEDVLLGEASGCFTGSVGQYVVVEDAQGQITVFLNGKQIIAVAHDDPQPGTIAIVLEDVGVLPIDSIALRQSRLFIDNFLLAEGSFPSPHWEVQDGIWRILPIHEDAEISGDGGLAAKGNGRILLKQNSLQNYALEVLAMLDNQSASAIILSENHQERIEAVFCAGEVEIRKIINGVAVSLRRESHLIEPGWHQIGVSIVGNKVKAFIDGKERMASAITVGKGRVGLACHGSRALFDNLQVHFLRTIQDSPSDEPDDSAVLDIKASLR